MNKTKKGKVSEIQIAKLNVVATLNPRISTQAYKKAEKNKKRENN